MAGIFFPFQLAYGAACVSFDWVELLLHIVHCQVSCSYQLAISKALRETLEYLDGENIDDPEASNLLNELHQDDQNKPLRSTEYIEEQFKKYWRKREEVYDKMKRNIIAQLVASKGHVKDEL